MQDGPEQFFHLHLVSDATGETLISAGRAAAAQYPNVRMIEHCYRLVRTKRSLEAVIRKIEAQPGLVLYTLVDQQIGQVLEQKCHEMGLPCASVLEPVLNIFQTYLGRPADRRAGAQHVLDAAYFSRIEALNFALEHDDGQSSPNLGFADVILFGVSRTSKTPTSFYLANQGVKVANVPIVLDVEVDNAVEFVDGPLKVGLVASVDRIAKVRKHRELGTSGSYRPEHYVERPFIARELSFARQIFSRNNWPIVDVSHRSIEETAAAILALKDKQS